MEIKCPICGKKYHYDRKICQDCEDYSIYSGVAKIGDKNNHKWNCSVFLGIETLAFRASKFCDSIKNLTPEPNNFIINERKLYDWNSETASRFKRKKEGFPINIPPSNFSTIKKYGSDTSLVYE